MIVSHGMCDERFAGVRTAFEKNFASAGDIGASVAVVHEGRTVVDLWAGHLDEERTLPWERDTITNVWSTTKTMTALCALILADRGVLDLHAPVADYWPEFAAHGKGGVLVRHLMAHTAGLPGWDRPLRVEDLYDWDLATSRLADQAPWWEPGTASGYHAITQGFLVGEVVRRVTGQSMGTFFREQVAGPLGADFHIGVPPAADPWVAPVIVAPVTTLAEDVSASSIAFRAMSNPPLHAQVSSTEAWRRAEIPAANGHGNARSVARVQSVISHGGQVDGIRLLSTDGCEVVFQQQAEGTDLVLGLPVRLGIGYGLNSIAAPISPNPRACSWGGWGGSLVVNDLDARLTVAYVMNRMGDGTLGDTRAARVVTATFASLADMG